MVSELAMENVHSETYSLGIEQYVRDPAEWDGLFNVMRTILAVHEEAMSAVHAVSQGKQFRGARGGLRCFERDFLGPLCCLLVEETTPVG